MNLFDLEDQRYSSHFVGRMFSYEGFEGGLFVNSVIAWKTLMIEARDELDLHPDALKQPVRRIVAWTCLMQAFSDTPELDPFAMAEAIYACSLKSIPFGDDELTTYWEDHFRGRTADPTLEQFLELLLWWVWEEHDDADQDLDTISQVASQWAQYVMAHINGVLKGYFDDVPDYRI